MIKKKYIAPKVRLIALPESLCYTPTASEVNPDDGLRVYPNSSSTENNVDNSEFL